ncbi:MAG: MAPEG family protein [Pseudomonadota bacterium]
MALPITTGLTSVLCLLLIVLKWRTIGQRVKNEASLGDAGVRDLQVAIRSHANFIENAPLAVILIGLLEYGGAHSYLVLGLAATFIFARVMHPIGMAIEKAPNAPRVMGVMLTIGVFVVGAAYALYMVLV